METTMMMVIKPALFSPRLSGRNGFVSLKEVERAVVTLKPFTDDNKIKNCLDDFYGRKSPQTAPGGLVDLVKPMGGKTQVRGTRQLRHEDKKTNWRALCRLAITDSTILTDTQLQIFVRGSLTTSFE